MLLYGKPIAEKIKDELKIQVSTFFGENQKYVAILFFGDNKSSATYVHHKQKYAKEIWISTFIFWQGTEQDTTYFPILKTWTQKKYTEVNQIFELINFLNQDRQCIGIMIQLPLPEIFTQHKLELLQAINESKDIDGLWGSLIWKSFCDMIEFCPATPKAVFTLLDAYNLGNLRGKKVAIVWQSIIVGKHLALESIKRWAIVQCFDLTFNPEEIKKGCQDAEYLFCATGVIDLINDEYLNKEGNQILIDIWYGHKQGKAAGDIDFEKVKDKIKHITPVPGWIGPLTIASLFSNVIVLAKQFWNIWK